VDVAGKIIVYFSVGNKILLVWTVTSLTELSWLLFDLWDKIVSQVRPFGCNTISLDSLQSEQHGNSAHLIKYLFSPDALM
jgi:hypothetical protein